MVAECTGGINVVATQELVQVGTLNIQDILLAGSIGVDLLVPHQLAIDLAGDHATHTVNARENYVQDPLLQETQSQEVLDSIVREHDAHHELVGVGVGVDALENVESRLAHLVLDRDHIVDIASSHLRLVELETHDPLGGTVGRVGGRELLEPLEDLAVLRHSRIRGQREGVVVHPHRLGDIADSRLLEFTSHHDRPIKAVTIRGGEVDKVQGLLGALGNTQELLDTRNTRSGTGLDRAGRVESVQRELGGRLTD